MRRVPGCDSAVIASLMVSIDFSAASRADLDRLVGAMEIEPADAAKPRADQHIGRIAGEPRARDAVLHDVEGLDHDGRSPGGRGRP